MTPKGEIALKHTTPDPIEIHRLLAQLKKDGIDHLALEASSHGLDQFRLDGVEIAACGFTNITRDHMDYHADFEHYLRAKLRLFGEVVREGGLAVVNADAAYADRFVAAAKTHGLTVMTVGERGDAIRLLSREGRIDGQTLKLRHAGRDVTVSLPLAGSFRLPTPWSPPRLSSASAATRTRSSPPSNISRAPPAAWRRLPSPLPARLSMSTTPTPRIRSRKCSPPSVRTSRASCTSCSAVAATATRASAR